MCVCVCVCMYVPSRVRGGADVQPHARARPQLRADRAELDRRLDALPPAANPAAEPAANPAAEPAARLFFMPTYRLCVESGDIIGSWILYDMFTYNMGIIHIL
jgi:hypothetical protein